MFHAHAPPSGPCRTGARKGIADWQDRWQIDGGKQAEEALPGWSCLGSIRAMRGIYLEKGGDFRGHGAIGLFSVNVSAIISFVPFSEVTPFKPTHKRA